MSGVLTECRPIRTRIAQSRGATVAICPDYLAVWWTCYRVPLTDNASPRAEYPSDAMPKGPNPLWGLLFESRSGESGRRHYCLRSFGRETPGPLPWI